MTEFLSFRRMLTPVLMQILYWNLTLGSIAYGVYALIRSGDVGFRMQIAPFEPVPLAVILIVAVPLAIRVWTEFAIVLFTIHRSLNDIRINLDGQSQGTTAPLPDQRTDRTPLVKPASW